MSASTLEGIPSLHLELETFRGHLMWMVGTKSRFPARATCALKCGATSFGSIPLFLIQCDIIRMWGLFLSHVLKGQHPCSFHLEATKNKAVLFLAWFILSVVGSLCIWDMCPLLKKQFETVYLFYFFLICISFSHSLGKTALWVKVLNPDEIQFSNLSSQIILLGCRVQELCLIVNCCILCWFEFLQETMR